MLGITDLGTYVVGTIAIVLLPGPNTLFVLTTAARDGVRAGYRAAGGVFLGDWILMMSAAAGVASLLRAFPPLFFVIRYAGAAYLAWVGLNLVRDAVRRWRTPASAAPVAEPAAPERRPFRRALVISLLNPKAILFVVSFFIQFVDPAYPHPVVPFAILAVILSTCSALYLSAIIFGSTFLARQVRRRRRMASGVVAGAGALFVAFSVKLATATLE